MGFVERGIKPGATVRICPLLLKILSMHYILRIYKKLVCGSSNLWWIAVFISRDKVSDFVNKSKDYGVLCAALSVK